METPSPKQARDTLVVSSVPEKASGQQLVVWSDGKHIEARYFRPLDALFPGSAGYWPAPLTVVFTDTTSPLDKADRWAWDFGDGHLIVAQQHPQHSYSAPGVYSVTLTVSDSRSGESESLLLPAAAITVTEATIQERTITYTYDSISAASPPPTPPARLTATNMILLATACLYPDHAACRNCRHHVHV